MTQTEVNRQTGEVMEADPFEGSDFERLLSEPAMIRARAKAEACSPEKMALMDHMKAAIRMADAVKDLEQAFDQKVMDALMPLMNRKMGFMTDKDPKRSKRCNTTYSPKEVKDCMIDAIIFGLRMTGNEFNIIAGTMYPAQAGMLRKVKELPGFTDFKPNTEIESKSESDGVCLVRCTASWKVNGKDDSVDTLIPVKYDQYSSDDQILGKALRKLLMRIWIQASGANYEDPEDTRTLKQKAIDEGDKAKALMEKLGKSENAGAADLLDKPVSKPQKTNKEILDEVVYGLADRLEVTPQAAYDKINAYSRETYGVEADQHKDPNTFAKAVRNGIIK